MASIRHPHGHQQTYDSPSEFFDAMDYDNNATSAQQTHNYQYATDYNNAFKANSKLNGLIDPMLSSNQSNSFNLDSKSFNLGVNFWNDPNQFGALQTINPSLSPLGGNQSCDTGYVSQEGSHSKSPPMAGHNQYNTSSRQANTSSKPRKRSSTKSTSTKASVGDTKPARKARRTSKAASIAPTDEELEGMDDDKREQFLARNREAASKCRQKKKEWTQDLEQKARDLSAQKQMLTTYLAMLKNELLMLKCKCLEHSDCQCQKIRDYLSSSVNTMPPANADLYSRLGDTTAANDIANEIARKQSCAPVFNMGSMSPPEGMVASPSSNGGNEHVGADILRFEAELQAAVTG